MRLNTRSSRVLTATALAGLAMVSCGDPVAPDNATIQLSADTVSPLALGAVTSVTAVVLESDGSPVVDGTVVTFSTTAGTLSRDSAAAAAPAINIGTSQGVATALLHAPMVAGSAVVTAKSGKATATVTITLAGLVAPAGAAVTLSAIPDTLAVGAQSQITAYLTASGNALADNTRVLFSVSAGSASPTIALTAGGFAATRFTAPVSAGIAWVRLQSGSLTDSVQVVVQ